MKEMRLADIATANVSVAHVIKKICPNLYNLNLRYDEATKLFDIDFYFDDDPRKDEEGYLGHGINEFVPDSPTYNRLITIMYILKYCLGLNWDDENNGTVGN